MTILKRPTPQPILKVGHFSTIGLYSFCQMSSHILMIRENDLLISQSWFDNFFLDAKSQFFHL